MSSVTKQLSGTRMFPTTATARDQAQRVMSELLALSHLAVRFGGVTWLPRPCIGGESGREEVLVEG